MLDGQPPSPRVEGGPLAPPGGLVLAMPAKLDGQPPPLVGREPLAPPDGLGLRWVCKAGRAAFSH